MYRQLFPQVSIDGAWSWNRRAQGRRRKSAATVLSGGFVSSNVRCKECQHWRRTCELDPWQGLQYWSIKELLQHHFP